MPRRLPVRPAKVFGNFFVLIVLCLMSFIYYTTVVIVWVPKAKRKYNIFIEARLTWLDISTRNSSHMYLS